MAHLSGTFSDPSPGRLVCTLSGSFFEGTNRDVGFPSGASNMMVAATVNGVTGPAIDRYAPTTEFELDYPGGNASWAISTSTISYQSGSIAGYGFTKLRLVAKLHKKT